jgi:transposase
MSKCREYSPEFKREAVELSRTDGVKVGQLAEELGIGANMLSRLRREQEQDEAKAFQGHGKARVKKEQDFLKEAAALS